MTIAEQIKNAVTAAISDLRAALVKTPAATSETPTHPAPVPSTDPTAIPDQVRAEITLAIQAALEPINTELNQTKADLATAKQTINTLQGQIAEKDQTINGHLSTINQLQATIANPKGKIQTLASAKAAEIAGAQGCAALPANPSANPAAAPNANATANLKGRARLEAAIAADLATKKSI